MGPGTLPSEMPRTFLVLLLGSMLAACGDDDGTDGGGISAASLVDGIYSINVETVDAVKAITAGTAKPEVPDLEPEPVDLASYDELLMGVSA